MAFKNHMVEVFQLAPLPTVDDLVSRLETEPLYQAVLRQYLEQVAAERKKWRVERHLLLARAAAFEQRLALITAQEEEESPIEEAEINGLVEALPGFHVGGPYIPGVPGNHLGFVVPALAPQEPELNDAAVEGVEDGADDMVPVVIGDAEGDEEVEEAADNVAEQAGGDEVGEAAENVVEEVGGNEEDEAAENVAEEAGGNAAEEGAEIVEEAHAHEELHYREIVLRSRVVRVPLPPPAPAAAGHPPAPAVPEAYALPGINGLPGHFQEQLVEPAVDPYVVEQVGEEGARIRCRIPGCEAHPFRTLKGWKIHAAQKHRAEGYCQRCGRFINLPQLLTDEQKRARLEGHTLYWCPRGTRKEVEERRIKKRRIELLGYEEFAQAIFVPE